MKKVMAFGSFEVFHKGHKHYLKEAKSYGDFLTVIVSRDSNLERIKGRPAYAHEEDRIERVAQEEYVDEALLGYLTDLYKIVVEEAPDVIVLGYDQQVDEEKLRKELKSRGFTKFEIKRAKAYMPKKYKSSLLKKD